MSIDIERAGAVGYIVLNRPKKLNAMTDSMWSALELALAELENDPSVNVIVLSGAGHSFCAGSDVSTLISEEPLSARMRASNRCVLAITECDKPVVARVHGVAAGAGANLALACDLVLTSTDARFIQVFIRRGLTLDTGGSWLLPRLVSGARARELAFLGNELAAGQALDWGLVNRVVDPIDLGPLTEEITKALATSRPAALAASKRLLRAATVTDLRTALEAEIAEQTEVIDGSYLRTSLTAAARNPNGADRR